MKPFFREGDILSVEAVSPGEIKPGNVIAYHAPHHEEWVVHRVVAAGNRGGETGFITRGDNLLYPDELVQADWVVGKVTGKYKNKQLVRISRLEELFGLLCSGWYRRTIDMAGSIIRPLVLLLSPLLPIRTIIFRNGSEGERMVAVLLGKVIAEKAKIPQGERLWVHPLFRKTRILDRMRA